MLDDRNILKQRDPQGALEVARTQFEQTQFNAEIHQGAHDGREIRHVVVAGMGGSALAALIAKTWLGGEMNVSFETVRTYDLPAYVGHDTLVIVSSYSGNTEETLSGLAQAQQRGAQVAIISSGGALIERAKSSGCAYVQLPAGFQPRMGVIFNLKALVALLQNFSVIANRFLDEITESASWLEFETSGWASEISTDRNYAKQLALLAVGKTPVFYGGALTAPIAYKWKISWNENAKNVAFWNEYPEFNHNEFLGWASHPVEKPFAVFDLVSAFEHPQILRRFEISDRLLSGRRPKSTRIALAGNSPLRQMLWASILADFASIYVAILNGVNPTPVELITKLKDELAK